MKTGEEYKDDNEWKSKGIPESDIRKDVRVIMPSLDLFGETKQNSTMAITNAQQYKQLMQNGGRIGLKGGGADVGASDKKSVDSRASKGYGAPSDSKPTYGGGGGNGVNKVDEVALTGGTKTKTKVTKTKDKDKRNIVKDYFDSRKKLAYNLSRKLPDLTHF